MTQYNLIQFILFFVPFYEIAFFELTIDLKTPKKSTGKIANFSARNLLQITGREAFNFFTKHVFQLIIETVS